MGAHNLADRAVGKTMREAYDSAVSYATSQYGHDAYNGSISTTNGFEDKTKELEQLLARKREGTYETRIKEGEGWNVVFKMVEKNFKDMTDDEWHKKCISDWEEEAWDNTEKWEKVWAARCGDINGDSLYLFAGWAAE